MSTDRMQILKAPLQNENKIAATRFFVVSTFLPLPKNYEMTEFGYNAFMVVLVIADENQ